MPTPKPQIRTLFSTPVCVHFLPIAHEVNPELRALVIDRMQATPATSTHGHGWHSPNDFESWGGQHAQMLFRVVRELGDGMTATRAGARTNVEWKVGGSATVRNPGEYAPMISRPGTFWSGLYFVDDGYNKDDDEKLGGEIELADPRGALPAMVAPHLAFRIPGGVNAGGAEIIRPQTGMIVLHPSWVARAERRYQGATQRITIEFELTPP